MRLDRRVAVAVLAAFLAAAAPAAAQDAQYWSNTYGTRSTLLSGAVIGSVTDLSATFYNPGALALFQEPAFILGAQAWDFSSIVVKNGGGEGLDLTASLGGPAPDLVAGLLPFHIVNGDQLAYSFLTRQSANIRVQTRTGTVADVTPVFPGPETLVGAITLEENMYESWTGATWSVPYGSHVGLGVTQYLAYRSQRARLETLAQALSTGGQVASATQFKEFDFTDWRAVTKVGVGFRSNSLTLGLSVTSPGLHLLGSGTVVADTAITGFDLNGDGSADPVFSANAQRRVDASYRSPLSVGFGGGYVAGHTILHASAEWFDGIDRYRVIHTSPYLSQSSGVVVESPIEDGTKSVFDFGFGVTQHFSEHFSGFASFSVDRSPRSPRTQLSIGAWDNYHVSTGAEFQVGKTSLLLGVAYTSGSANVQQLADLRAANGLGAGPAPDAEVQFRSLRLVFGFSYGSGS